MDIRSIVHNLIKKHKTSNPYEIAKDLNIEVCDWDLGSVRGYYFKYNRIKMIFLNAELPDHLKRFVLAHEIGHAVMHPNSCTPFLQTTFWSIDKLETEANKFAAELIINDLDLMEHWEYTVGEWAMFYGLPREIIELRFE